MKPDFALSLSFDGIVLLLRGPDGWLRVGAVALEAADLAGELAALRDRARALRPGGLLTKLVIPDAQIRYLTVETGAVDDRLRARLVRDALDGVTPYALDELVFDWQATGARTHVAAVARETLEEAEAFALEHRFNPVAFVATPHDGGFEGEVSFGETASAGELLPQGARVERDAQPVEVTGDAPLSGPDETAAEGQARSAAAAAHAPPSETRRPPEERTELPLPAADPDAPLAPAPDTGTGESGARVTAEAAPRPDGTAVEDGAAPPAGGADPGQGETSAAGRGAPPRDAEATRATAPRLSMTPPSRGNAEGSADRAPTDPPPAASPRHPPGGPADAPSSSEPDAPKGPEEARAPTQAPVPEFRSLRRPAQDEGPAPAIALRWTPEAPAPAAQPPRTEAPPPHRPPPGTPTPEATARRDLILRRIAAAQTGAPDAGTGDAGTGDARPGMDADPAQQPGAPRAAAPPGPEEDEARRLTRFGERRAQRRAAKRPRRRAARGAAVAVVAMIGLGASAALFAPDGVSRLLLGAPPPPVAAVAPPPAPSPEETARDTPFEAADPEPPASSDPVPAGDAPTAKPDQPADPPAPDQRPLDIDEAAARYAATGLWQKAPERREGPSAGSLAGLTIAGTDSAVAAPEAGVLRSPETATDTPPESPFAPPPPGTVFDLDARGLVVATPEGALTPQGARVIAGRPPVAPPPRASPEERRAAEAAAAAAARRAALEGLRPLARPAGRLPEDEEAEAPALADPLAAVDPLLRPEDIAAETPDAAAEAPDTDSARERETIDGGAGTRQAVRASLEPAVRPGGLAEVVAAAPAMPAPAPAQTVAPDIPSNASVARAATETDAIELRRVNLIGVYGAPANRRALVRLSDGRYQKVQVGDRLDGGRISAIGEDQLRYVKNGRNLVLRMPQG